MGKKKLNKTLNNQRNWNICECALVMIDFLTKYTVREESGSKQTNSKKAIEPRREWTHLNDVTHLPHNGSFVFDFLYKIQTIKYW